MAAVVIQDGKVLLTQEASHTIRGKWYLPCGKMEPNDSKPDIKFKIFIGCALRYLLMRVGGGAEMANLISKS